MKIIITIAAAAEVVNILHHPSKCPKLLIRLVAPIKSSAMIRINLVRKDI